MNNLQIELVWNREFNWCPYGNLQSDLETAKKLAIDIRDSGDGARVKKVRVINIDSGKVEWNG